MRKKKGMTNEEWGRYLLNETDKNVFLTGPAGTGKTTLIKDFIKDREDVVVCAPTGVAAVNIGGDTMHKVFCIPVPAYGSEPSKVKESQIKLLLNCSCIIIDEISMARNDVFSFAMRIVKRAERIRKKTDPNNYAIRVVVVGDFKQLPPVVQKNEQKKLVKYGFDPSGYAFTTKEWKQMNFEVVELTDIKRQDNVEFISHLQEARDQNPDCLEYFNSFVTEEVDEDAVNLCGTNAEADRINKEYLDSLEGAPVAYQAEKKGRTANSGIDDIVLLKEDAHVFFTVNDNIHGLYANGTFGVVVHCDSKFVDVEVDGEIIRVFPHKYSCYSYSTSKGLISKKEIGTVSQIPLRIAKAVTIHKSQGKTFDRVRISPEIFAAGQLYVALSRVRTPEGLSLTGPINEDALKSDDLVDQFYKSGFEPIVYQPVKKKTATKSTQKKTEETKKAVSLSSKKQNTTKKVPNKPKSASKTKKATATAKTKKKPLKRTTKATRASKAKKTVKKTTKTSSTHKRNATKKATNKTTKK